MTRERSVATGVTERGLVTIAIPTFNGARWLSDAIASALGQTYAHTEILVVDDASDDNSPEIAASTGDDRVRVVRNERRLGLAGNWNRCIAEARGEYLKFVFQDDLLHPACVEELVALMRESPSVGLAFTPRRIELDEPDDPAARRWAARYHRLHLRLAPLERVNHGRTLFDRQISRAPFRNCIGEPTAVMLRTSVIRSLTGFNPRLHQLVDAEMWLRMMFVSDVGFIDRALATFRVHRGAATQRHMVSGAAWLDPVWFAEGLLEDQELRKSLPNGASLRIRAFALVLRGEVGRLARRRVPAVVSNGADLTSYLRHLLGSARRGA